MAGNTLKKDARKASPSNGKSKGSGNGVSEESRQFGEKMREARNRRSLEDVGRQTSIAHQDLRAIEDGDREVTRVQSERIARALEIPDIQWDR